MNREDLIRITEHDLIWLSELPAMPGLTEELERAQVVPWDLLPHDVVTMNSHVLFDDEATGERRAITIVYPRDADAGQGRVSVWAPVGTALLGLAAGQSIEWPFPDGKTRRLRVVEVLYQPEAAHKRWRPGVLWQKKTDRERCGQSTRN
ncbi:MAG: nucleoside diphosphate kinase regulator [Chromatiales bacterium]